MESLSELEKTIYAFGLVAIAAATLALALMRWRSSTWFGIPRLRPGDWSGIEVFLVFVLLLLVPGTVATTLAQLGVFEALYETEDVHDKVFSNRRVVWSQLLAAVLFVAGSMTMLFLKSATRGNDAGATLSRWQTNVILGVLGFLVITPVVLVIYKAAQFFFPISEDHPLIELAKKPRHMLEPLAIFTAAVLAAPLFEEWTFRGVLQFWLRRASLLGHIMVALFTGVVGFLFGILRNSEPITLENLTINVDPIIFAGGLACIYLALVYRLWRPILNGKWEMFRTPRSVPTIDGEPEPPLQVTLKPEELLVWDVNGMPFSGKTWERWKWHSAWLSVFGSAMLFATIHSNVWPSPIPLFVFGLGVGALALRTQSLVPGLVTHALFNLVAFLVMQMEAG